MGNFRLVLLFILTGSILFLSCSGNSKINKLDEFLSYCNQNGVFNGTICIMENNDIIYKEAFGLADLTKKEELSTNHAFYLASVSKQFTTMAVMILKERNKLNYNESLRKYFPEFPPYADRIKIVNLMTHTSGIPDHFQLGAYRPDLTNQDVLKLLIKQDSLNFESGEAYLYSNGAYVLLALIVEKASGQPFHQFMQENIFDPLSMNSTLVYDESKPGIPKRAIGYTMFGEKADYDILTTGAGGIYSTVEDLAKWNIALSMNKLIKRETLEEAYTSYKLNSDSLTNYGYGWNVRNDSLGRRVFHSGELAGFRTFLERNLDTGISFFYLTNFGNSLARGSINEGIRNILNNKPYSLPKIPISIVMNSSIKKGGIEEAVVEYNNLKIKGEDKYNFNEEQLNSLGHYYLRKDMIAQAIEIFKLNVKSYPNAYNTYNSLGEAYLENKQYDLAIASYEKSLELNSGNKNAEGILEKIESLKKIP